MYKEIKSIDSNNYKKAELYFYIIQFKDNNRDLYNEGNSIYIDAKRFILVYINSIDERDCGYDVIDVEKILRCINLIDNPSEQFQLSKATYRLLKNKGFEEESNKLKKIIHSKKTKLLRDGKKYVKLIMHLSTYNIYIIGLLVFILFLIPILLLLPAPYENWEYFQITYHNYSNIFFLNHLINILASFLGISNDFRVETISLFSTFSIIIIKLFYIIFIVNYLYKKILDIFNNN